MKAAMKNAAAYLRNGRIYLHPDSRTIKGFWIACEPILVTSENDKSLGAHLLQILAKSTENVPDPESLATSDSWNVIRAWSKRPVPGRMKPLLILPSVLESGSTIRVWNLRQPGMVARGSDFCI